MSIREAQRLTELEKTIGDDLNNREAVSLALAEIRDLRLYKQEYSGFGEYCQAKWGWTRQQANQRIAGGGQVTRLKLSEIVMDAGTQVRAGMNEATVTDYAEAMADGAKFPAIVVFYDGSRHLAADGFHRINAALKNGATKIECDVRHGTKTDALKFALGCNAHHGLRRTNADKRHAVGMALLEFPKVSDRALAEMCLVSHTLVAETRAAQVATAATCPPVSGANGSPLTPPSRIGKDGKAYRLPPPPIQPSGAQTPAGGSATGKPATTAAPTLPPPPPSQVLDGTGWPIPTQLIPLWQRTNEVQEMLTTLSKVKGALRTAQENKDKLFTEVNFSSALSQLDQAWADVKTAKPFAVCPTCQGQLPDQCTLCRGRGLISEHRWKACVTREDKEFRLRAATGHQAHANGKAD